MNRAHFLLSVFTVAGFLVACSRSTDPTVDEAKAANPTTQEKGATRAKPEANPHLIALTDAAFDETVLKASTPVFVDFWAEWCGPCKMIAPVFAELATAYEGKIKFGKVDIDQNSKVTQQYGITAIPALLLFKNGRVAETVVGVKSKEELKRLLDKHLDSSQANSK